MRAGDEGAAVECFEAIKYLGLSADKASYATIMKVFTKTGRAQDALVYLEEMEKKRIPADAFVYNSFLGVCEADLTKANQALALKIFDRMVASSDAKPNAVTISMMVKLMRNLPGSEADPFIAHIMGEVRKGYIELDSLLVSATISSFKPGNNRELIDEVFDIYTKTGEQDEKAYISYTRYLAHCLRQDLTVLRTSLLCHYSRYAFYLDPSIFFLPRAFQIKKPSTRSGAR